MAKEFSGEGDFIVCPGYVGPFGNSTSADKWGRLYLPGAMTGYSASRSTLLKWRRKTAEDERYSWWPEAMRKRGVEPIKVSSTAPLVSVRRSSRLNPPALSPQASDIIKGARLTSWQKYVDVYHKASKVRVAMRTRDRQIRELAIEAKDDTNDAAGALVSLADA